MVGERLQTSGACKARKTSKAAHQHGTRCRSNANTNHTAPIPSSPWRPQANTTEAGAAFKQAVRSNCGLGEIDQGPDQTIKRISLRLRLCLFAHDGGEGLTQGETYALTRNDPDSKPFFTRATQPLEPVRATTLSREVHPKRQPSVHETVGQSWPGGHVQSNQHTYVHVPNVRDERDKNPMIL